jgi:hypothetical protein
MFTQQAILFPTRSQWSRTDDKHTHPASRCTPFFYTWLHHAPISYEVAFILSARTVIDHTLHSPFPTVTLTLTQPGLNVQSQRAHVLSCDHQNSPGSLSARSTPFSAALTNIDMLYMLMTCVAPSPEEWHC